MSLCLLLVFLLRLLCLSLRLLERCKRSFFLVFRRLLFLYLRLLAGCERSFFLQLNPKRDAVFTAWNLLFVFFVLLFFCSCLLCFLLQTLLFFLLMFPPLWKASLFPQKNNSQTTLLVLVSWLCNFRSVVGWLGYIFVCFLCFCFAVFLLSVTRKFSESQNDVGRWSIASSSSQMTPRLLFIQDAAFPGRWLGRRSFSQHEKRAKWQVSVLVFTVS